MLSEYVLNLIDKIGVPQHDLKLKVGDICFIIRNLHINDGICNSVRCEIVRISDHIISVRLLDGSKQIVDLPRIKFVFRLQHGHSFEMIRQQFPLRRAYAMTFNRSQGQTLKNVVLDLRSKLFGHGFLYVGLSRVTDWRNIVLFAKDSCLYFRERDSKNEEEAHFNGGVIVNNNVYRDFIAMFEHNDL